MRRRLFNVLAGMSLLLCIATAALWVLSYRYTDRIHSRGWRCSFGLVSSYGRIGIEGGFFPPQFGAPRWWLFERRNANPWNDRLIVRGQVFRVAGLGFGA